MRHGLACSTALTLVLVATLLPSEKAMRADPDRQDAADSASSVKPAVDGVLDLFKQKPVVALGDFHWLAQEEMFYSTLIRDRRFAESVGNVVVEFGGEASQGIVDRYVAGEDVPATELRKVWTETAGWVPGPTALGYVNFFVNARAANLKLPPGHRIKIWLGDPKIDWSQINSFQDLQPYLSERDDNFFRIISDEILKKHEKTLLIIGTGHLFGPKGLGPLSARISEQYPNTLAIVSPFVGYSAPECNAKVAAQAKDWPVPSLVGPIEAMELKSPLRLPGCDYSVPDQRDMWANAEAILYLGEPDSLTTSTMDPDIYLDSDYFREENRRLRCCTPSDAGLKPMDWNELVQRASSGSRKFNTLH